MALYKNLGVICLCKYSRCRVKYETSVFHMLICIILALVMIFIFVINILYLMKGFLFVYSFHEIQIFDYCRQCEAAHVIEVMSYTEEVLDTCVIPCAQFERFWC